MKYKQYHSQYGQDGFLVKFFNAKKNGKFIDVGAYDGITFSNTYYLEKELDWSGICVEPNPIPFKKLKTSRNSVNLNCGIGEYASEMKFLAVSGAGEMLSGFLDTCDEHQLKRIEEYVTEHGVEKNIILVPVRPLKDILNEIGIYDIDYCNIDVEGGELSVLKSIDFSTTKIKLLSVENNKGSKDVKNYLEKFGYTLIEKIGADEFYEADSKNYLMMLRYKYKRVRRKISYLKNDIISLFKKA